MQLLSENQQINLSIAVKHNVITTKSIKSLLVQVCEAILVIMVTMQPFAFYLICTWAVEQTIYIVNNSLNYDKDTI